MSRTKASTSQGIGTFHTGWGSREIAKPSSVPRVNVHSVCRNKCHILPLYNLKNSPPIKLLLVRLAKSATLIRLYTWNLHDSTIHHKPCFHAQLSIVSTRFQGTVASPLESPVLRIAGCSVCPCLLSIPLMPMLGQSLEPVCWTYIRHPLQRPLLKHSQSPSLSQERMYLKEYVPLGSMMPSHGGRHTKETHTGVVSPSF